MKVSHSRQCRFHTTDFNSLNSI